MNIKVQFILEGNPYLKRYLQEHSGYYKNLIRDPSFIQKLEELMRNEYGFTFPAKLAKIKDNISMINTFMDVLK